MGGFKGFFKNIVRSVVYPVLLTVFVIYSYSLVDDIRNERIDISWITNMMDFSIPDYNIEDSPPPPEFTFSNSSSSFSLSDSSQKINSADLIKHLEEKLIDLSQQCHYLTAETYRTTFDVLNAKCYNSYDFKLRINDESLATVANPYYSEYKKFQNEIAVAANTTYKPSDLTPLYSEIEPLVSKCGADCERLLAAIIDTPPTGSTEAEGFTTSTLNSNKEAMKKALKSKLDLSLNNHLINWKHSDHKDKVTTFKESIQLSCSGKYSELSKKLKQSFEYIVNMLKGLGDKDLTYKLNDLAAMNMPDEIKYTVEKFKA